MHLAFISTMNGFPWGGSEELWFKAALMALSDQHKISTLTKKWDNLPEKISALKSKGARVKFYENKVPSIATRVLNKLGVYNSVLQWDEIADADAYVVSNGGSFDFMYYRRFCEQLQQSGKPYVLISQHNVEHGHIVETEAKQWLLPFIAGAQRFFFVAERNLKTAERQLAISLPNAQVISNPVNIRSIGIKPFPEGKRLLKLACVARLDCNFKGQDLLLQAFSGSQWNEREFELNFYGYGPHENYLKELVRFYNLEKKVFLRGHITDIDRIWEGHEALLLPSLSEGTPLSVIEAMLSGRAVLATNVGGVEKYVLDKVTGFLSAAPTVGCLEDSLKDLWQNRQKLPEIGKAAFSHALSITDLDPQRILLNALGIKNFEQIS